jgi:hypothetical protein
LAESVNFYLNALGDEYAPTVPNPPLQQYSPYQTDDIYCVDIASVVKDENGNIVENNNLKLQEFLAVQSYSISPIRCDFNKIAKDYP